ncbi:glycoside hydrolase, partial [Auricularia subglabra TFB-10046 SS5]
ISFWMASFDGPKDISEAWAQFDPADKKRIADTYRAANKTLRIGVFGGAEPVGIPSSYDPNDIATKVAAFVKDNYLHAGVDIDYEDSPSFEASTRDGENFVIQLTRTLREELPAEDGYIISHAPQAPYFTTAPATYPNGAYRTIHQEVGDLIDFYNIQYYNQGDGVYTDCESLLTSEDGPSSSPGTSIAGIMKGTGVPREKIVVGKPAHTADAEPGFMDPKAVGECIRNVPAELKPGGLMTWQWTPGTKDDLKAWITDARADL